MKKRLPVVAIIGRPNVGKSTLFNRITRSRQAIVDDQAGVTRDRHYRTAEWNGRTFQLMDTGGYVPDRGDQFTTAIREQAELGLAEADVVLFLADAQTGVTDVEQFLARTFLNREKPFLLVVNKVDNEKMELETGEFYSLGLGDPLPIAANSGRGVGDLLDALVKLLPEKGDRDPASEGIQLAIVGKPNVGKSSLVNTLLGENRLIVTPVAGTTRDTTDTPYRYRGQLFNLIDTAGLRRRTKVKENIEFYANLRTQQAITRCQVALVLMDATDPYTGQDVHIVQQVLQSQKGVILVINKWDLVEKDTHTAERFRREILERAPNLGFIPMEFVSVINRQRLFRLLDRVLEVHERQQQKLTSAELEDYLLPLVEKTPPPARKGKFIRFHRIYQLRAEPPVFIFTTRYPQLVDSAYSRFLERKIREKFDFRGVPLRIEFRAGRGRRIRP